MSLLAALTVTSVFTFNLRPADWRRWRDEQMQGGGERKNERMERKKEKHVGLEDVETLAPAL